MKRSEFIKAFKQIHKAALRKTKAKELVFSGICDFNDQIVAIFTNGKKTVAMVDIDDDELKGVFDEE